MAGCEQVCNISIWKHLDMQLEKRASRAESETMLERSDDYP